MTQTDQDPDSGPPTRRDEACGPSAPQDAVSAQPEPLNLGSGLPQRFEGLRVSDNAHARAYNRVGDMGRARIKQAIARLYALHLPNAPDMSACAQTFSAAQVAKSRRTSPRPWYLLALDPAHASPAQLLAAILPAVARRVPQIAVARPRSRHGWPDALLAGLELCGVETVFSPPKGDFAQLVRYYLETQGPGGVGCLGGPTFWSAVQGLCAPFAQAACHWFRCPGEIGLWAGPDAPWDAAALRFAHPEACFAVFGGPFEAEQPRPGGWQALREARLEAVFAPLGHKAASAALCMTGQPDPVADAAPHVADGTAPAPGQAYPAAACASGFQSDALSTASSPLAPLVLAPGMECFWDFPDAPAGLYEQSCTAYTTD